MWREFRSRVSLIPLLPFLSPFHKDVLVKMYSDIPWHKRFLLYQKGGSVMAFLLQTSWEILSNPTTRGLRVIKALNSHTLFRFRCYSDPIVVIGNTFILSAGKISYLLPSCCSACSWRPTVVAVISSNIIEIDHP